MRTYLKAAIIFCFLLLWAGTYYLSSIETRAQEKPGEPYLSANQQQSEFPTNVNLSCSGCHGPGKPLPLLRGEQFHKDAHGAMDQSIHAKAGPNGGPLVSCADCHTVNGDMTTILPAEDPKSTVNRANTAQTCAKCHEASANSFHFSIHGSRRDIGQTKPASCADCHGSHSILPLKEAGSTMNRANAELMCAKCHAENVAT
jgi:hypothetical protein